MGMGIGIAADDLARRRQIRPRSQTQKRSGAISHRHCHARGVNPVPIEISGARVVHRDNRRGAHSQHFFRDVVAGIVVNCRGCRQDMSGARRDHRCCCRPDQGLNIVGPFARLLIAKRAAQAANRPLVRLIEGCHGLQVLPDHRHQTHQHQDAENLYPDPAWLALQLIFRCGNCACGHLALVRSSLPGKRDTVKEVRVTNAAC